MTKLFNALKSADDQREFIVSRINVGDLALMQGFAELEEDNELAYMIWDVRNH